MAIEKHSHTIEILIWCHQCAWYLLFYVRPLVAFPFFWQWSSKQRTPSKLWVYANASNIIPKKIDNDRIKSLLIHIRLRFIRGFYLRLCEGGGVLHKCVIFHLSHSIIHSISVRANNKTEMLCVKYTNYSINKISACVACWMKITLQMKRTNVNELFTLHCYTHLVAFFVCLFVIWPHYRPLCLHCLS